MNTHIAVKHEQSIALTASLENYLKAIHSLEQAESKSVRLTDISRKLSVTKTSVNRAVGTLKQHGLVNHEHYGTVSLTPKGKRYAENVQRGHIVLRAFLTCVLGVEPDIADREACMLEHYLSISTIDKCEHFMKNFLKRSSA